MPLVYSPDRVRRLRLVLGVDLVAGGLMCLLALFVVITTTDYRVDGVIIGAAGTTVLLAVGLALMWLPERDRRAKVAAAVTGVLTVVVGFLFAKMILGFAMIVLGLVILVLALLPDDPDLVT